MEVYIPTKPFIQLSLTANHISASLSMQHTDVVSSIDNKHKASIITLSTSRHITIFPSHKLCKLCDNISSTIGNKLQSKVTSSNSARTKRHQRPSKQPNQSDPSQPQHTRENKHDHMTHKSYI